MRPPSTVSARPCLADVDPDLSPSLHRPQIEQWTETRYPSFIQIGQPVPTSSDEWAPGRDARIRQLPGPSAEVLEKRARAERLKRQEGKSLGKEDVSLARLSFSSPSYAS